LTSDNEKEKEENKELIDKIMKNLTNFDFEKKITTPYIGYNKDDNIKRILAISHSSVIKEIINSILFRKGLQINDTTNEIIKNGSLLLLRIRCNVHKNIKCENIDSCKIFYDISFYNDKKITTP